MRFHWNRFWTGALVLGLFVAAGPVGAAEETALCPVCRVMQGEMEREEVRAERTHDGVTFGFCSKSCAEEFDADPVAFLPPVFPRPAPPFELVGLDGETISGEAFEERLVLLDFWATWCLPCRTSMPELQGLHEEFADSGFAVIGVSIDERKDRDKVLEFVEEKGITYPIALDAEKDPAWHAYRVKAIPAAFLIDAEGNIVAQWTGRAASAKEVREHLLALRNGGSH